VADSRSASRRHPRRFARVAIGATAIALALNGCGNDARVHKPASRDLGKSNRAHEKRERTAREAFAAAAVWSAPLRTDAPVDPRSRQLVATLLSSVRAQMRDGTGPALSA